MEKWNVVKLDAGLKKKKPMMSTKTEHLPTHPHPTPSQAETTTCRYEVVLERDVLQLAKKKEQKWAV